MANERKIIDSLLKSEDDAEKIINELTPEENKAALELLEEKIDGTGEDTPSSDEEPETKTDTSESEEETGDDDSETPDDGDFTLDEDFIVKQPEDIQGILSKYKGKNREDLAEAAANAVAMKSPYLKDNEAMLSHIKQQLLEKSNSELINILVDTQRQSGKASEEQTKEKPAKIGLPEIPKDDPAINSLLEKETLKRLKEKYPTMPEVSSTEDESYKEWRRDLDVDDPDNDFRGNKAEVEKLVKSELSKVLYIQNELPNLYEESPQEIMPIFSEEALPRLKALNDNPMQVLVEDIQDEIQTIRKGLEKFGINEKDLGIDFTITKDEKGTPFNPVLNELITSGYTKDGKAVPSDRIIATRGKTFWLRKGELARKFREDYEEKILTAFFNNKVKTDKINKDRLKEETLREASGTGKGSRRTLSVEDIEKETNPERIKQILADLEKT